MTKINFDLHTHTTYSHGKGSIMDNAEVAKEKGLQGIAITDHGFSHPAFGMRRRKLDQMKKECVTASEKLGINVLLGIESNLRGERGSIDVKPKDYDKLDVILAGVHRFIIYNGVKDLTNLLMRNMVDELLKIEPSKSLVRYNTACYVNAIKNNPIDVVTHVGYLCFCDPVEIAKVASDYGTYIEINTKKVHLTDKQWQQVIDTGVKFVLDSDAHTPDRVGDTALFDELVKRVDFPQGRIMNIDGRLPKLRFTEFKKGL